MQLYKKNICRSDINLPYADLNTALSPDGEMLHNSEIIPSPSDSHVTTPQVRIYTCFVDEDNSRDKLDTTPNSEFSNEDYLLKTDLETGNPSKGQVAKARSLIDVSRNSANADRKSTRNESRSPSRSSNLQIPSQPDYFNPTGRKRCASSEGIIVNNGKLGAHIHLKRLSVGVEHVDLTESRHAASNLKNGSFSSLPDKTQYGTIYYV